MPNIHEDIQFLRDELKKGINWLRDYFKDKSADSKFDRTAAILDFGPFNGLKLLVAIIITIVFMVLFSLYRSEATLWVVLAIFFLAVDFLFMKGWIIPSITGFVGVFFTWIAEIAQEIGHVVIEIVMSLAMDIKEFALEIIQDILAMAAEIGKDVVGAIMEMIGDIFKGIGEMVRDIISIKD